jgi:hypothetical protein
MWHSIWHAFWHSILITFYLAYVLTFYLAFYLTYLLAFNLAFFLAAILTFFLVSVRAHACPAASRARDRVWVADTSCEYNHIEPAEAVRGGEEEERRSCAFVKI